jgi:hypothetical protein
MITPKQFEELSVYKTSSWAIWSEDFIKADCRKCNEEGQPKKYFKKNIELLKDNIILLGLNPSGKKKEQLCVCSNEMGNFHTVRNGKQHKGDLLLCKSIMNLKNISGAYMTDISEEVEGDSSKVSPDENCVEEQLEKILNILDSKKIHIVCFGNEVFSTVSNIYGNGKTVNKNGVDEFTIKWKDKDITFYKVYHYSYAARYGLEKKEKFKKQLKYVDSKLA